MDIRFFDTSIFIVKVKILIFNVLYLWKIKHDTTCNNTPKIDCIITGLSLFETS